MDSRTYDRGIDDDESDEDDLSRTKREQDNGSYDHESDRDLRENNDAGYVGRRKGGSSRNPLEAGGVSESEGEDDDFNENSDVDYDVDGGDSVGSDEGGEGGGDTRDAENGDEEVFDRQDEALSPRDTEDERGSRRESGDIEGNVSTSSGRTQPAFDKEEVINCAQHLGIDPVREPQFLWIAEAALTAPLPSGWKEYESVEGNLYFHHADSGLTQWEHPSDHHYREMYRQLSGKKALEVTASTSAGGETLRRRYVDNGKKEVAGEQDEDATADALKEEEADEPLTVESEEYAKLFDRTLPPKRSAALATGTGSVGNRNHQQQQQQGAGQQQRPHRNNIRRDDRPPPRTFGEYFVRTMNAEGMITPKIVDAMIRTVFVSIFAIIALSRMNSGASSVD